ncbi:MAG: hypothetical protein KF858_15865 [Candidatus Sumerlaeia bacterium]|nr:hypothetical protein [Candidatus Sumerlaeia bacterium]
MAPVPVLLYVINGHGLGHLAKTSLVLGALRERLDVAPHVFSNSPVATRFLDCPGTIVDLPLSLPYREQAARFERGFAEALECHRPRLVLCDTHWLTPCIQQARAAGARTALTLRVMNPSYMQHALDRAANDFDAVFLPHSEDEIAFRFADAPEGLDAIRRARVRTVGPIARHAPGDDAPRVLFTLGGGGEYPHVRTTNTVASFLDAFAAATARLRIERPDVPIRFAAGPLMEDSALAAWPGAVLRTLELHRHYGRGTVVVTRPGYNSCWEAVAAGARLVLVGDYKGFEDTQATRDYLSSRGLARCPATDGDALATAILEALDAPSHPAAAAAVNAGLAEMATMLVGILQS